MIEITTEYAEGVQFIKSVRVLEPDRKVDGVPVHLIDRKRADDELIRAIKAMGLRRLEFDAENCVDLYAENAMSALQCKVNGVFIKCYWAIIRWLYYNACLFRRIPEGERFSWRYFTFYCWYKSARKSWLR